MEAVRATAGTTSRSLSLSLCFFALLALGIKCYDPTCDGPNRVRACLGSGTYDQVGEDKCSVNKNENRQRTDPLEVRAQLWHSKEKLTARGKRLPELSALNSYVGLGTPAKQRKGPPAANSVPFFPGGASIEGVSEVVGGRSFIPKLEPLQVLCPMALVITWSWPCPLAVFMTFCASPWSHWFPWRRWVLLCNGQPLLHSVAGSPGRRGRCVGSLVCVWSPLWMRTSFFAPCLLGFRVLFSSTAWVPVFVLLCSGRCCFWRGCSRL